MGLLQEYDNENIIGDEDGAMKTKNHNATNIAKAKFQEKLAKNKMNERSLSWKLFYSHVIYVLYFP